MSRKSRKNEAFDLPSFQMIRAASNGDIEAINACSASEDCAFTASASAPRTLYSRVPSP